MLRILVVAFLASPAFSSHLVEPITKTLPFSTPFLRTLPLTGPTPFLGNDLRYFDNGLVRSTPLLPAEPFIRHETLIKPDPFVKTLPLGIGSPIINTPFVNPIVRSDVLPFVKSEPLIKTIAPVPVPLIKSEPLIKTALPLPEPIIKSDVLPLIKSEPFLKTIAPLPVAPEIIRHEPFVKTVAPFPVSTPFINTPLIHEPIVKTLPEPILRAPLPATPFVKSGPLPLIPGSTLAGPIDVLRPELGRYLLDRGLVRDDFEFRKFVGYPERRFDERGFPIYDKVLLRTGNFPFLGHGPFVKTFPEYKK